MKNNVKYDYDGIPIGYYDFCYYSNGVQGNWHRIKFDFIKNVCIGHSSSISILDIGCGPGTFLGNLQAKKSIGLDISNAQIDYANNKYGDESRAFILETECLKDQLFDVVTIIDVIEHLSESQIIELINKNIKYLKKGGTLIICTPNYKSHWPILEYFVNLFSKLSYQDQHITKFNSRNLNCFFMSNFKQLKFKENGFFMLFSPFIFFLGKKQVRTLAMKENNLFKKIYGAELYIILEKL